MNEAKLKVRWYVAQYSESTEELEAEYEIIDFDLEAFRFEFDDTESDYPMEGCFPIARGNIEFLEKYMNLGLCVIILFHRVTSHITTRPEVDSKH